MKKSEEQQAEELAELLDALFSSGSQHVDLEIGEETKVKTVNSTDCSEKPGACAVPNANVDDEEE